MCEEEEAAEEVVGGAAGEPLDAADDPVADEAQVEAGDDLVVVDLSAVFRGDLEGVHHLAVLVNRRRRRCSRGREWLAGGRRHSRGKGFA